MGGREIEEMFEQVPAVAEMLSRPGQVKLHCRAKI
jgi:hypothetical protein